MSRLLSPPPRCAELPRLWWRGRWCGVERACRSLLYTSSDRKRGGRGGGHGSEEELAGGSEEEEEDLSQLKMAGANVRVHFRGHNIACGTCGGMRHVASSKRDF